METIAQKLTRIHAEAGPVAMWCRANMEQFLIAGQLFNEDREQAAGRLLYKLSEQYRKVFPDHSKRTRIKSINECMGEVAGMYMEYYETHNLLQVQIDAQEVLQAAKQGLTQHWYLFSEQ